MHQHSKALLLGWVQEKCASGSNSKAKGIACLLCIALRGWLVVVGGGTLPYGLLHLHAMAWHGVDMNNRYGRFPSSLHPFIHSFNSIQIQFVVLYMSCAYGVSHTQQQQANHLRSSSRTKIHSMFSTGEKLNPLLFSFPPLFSSPALFSSPDYQPATSEANALTSSIHPFTPQS